MPDPLQMLWPAIEAVRPVFSRVAVVRWPKGTCTQLLSAKLIVPDGEASRIRCPACGRTHECKPVCREQPDGTVHYFIPCPEHLRAKVTQHDLNQWAVNVEELVRAVAGVLGLHGRYADLGSGRVWRCGRTTYGNAPRDVLFARGLRRNDAARFRRAITSAHRPIVFVGTERPEPDFWNGRIPTIVRLSEVASLVNDRIEMDTSHLVALVGIADGNPGSTDSGNMSLDQLKRAVRLQVNAEMKTTLDDDILRAAYCQAGSFRKAADLLNQNPDAKKRVTKDRVKRAVDHAGGIRAVIADADSDSVVRTVASQPRDRSKKFIPRPQTDADQSFTAH